MMKFPIAAAWVVALTSATAYGQDYGQGPHTYFLRAASSYQQGCWGPCACPLSNHETIRGTFTLNLISVGNVTDFYQVTNVQWNVPTLAGRPFGEVLTGSGTFSAGQVGIANHQHMTLDLTLAPALPLWGSMQHFETTVAAGVRTIAPPVIDIEVANSTSGCPGIRLRIVASRCSADWNADGSLSVQDIFDFLNVWFANDPAADFNASGALSDQDIFDFLQTWFAGCP